MRLLLALLAVLAFNADAVDRSAAQVAAFKRHNPCPSTGQRRGGCPGYVVDHVYPLCAGGIDHPSNMQWQSTSESRAKDREERRLCRSLKAHQP